MSDAAVAQIRRFNRVVTERIGALTDRYMRLDRPLGEARVLWEVGPGGCMVAQLRTVAAMAEVERLLTAAAVQITPTDPEHTDVRFCLEQYTRELNQRSMRTFDPTVGATITPEEARPPVGRFFIARLHGEAIGCGAVKHPAGVPAQIKRMWIAPEARGLGLGRRLLTTLENCARDAGADTALIETNSGLTEALTLYTSTGWELVAPFNDEPYADRWLRKALTPEPARLRGCLAQAQSVGPFAPRISPSAGHETVSFTNAAIPTTTITAR